MYIMRDTELGIKMNMWGNLPEKDGDTEIVPAPGNNDICYPNLLYNLNNYITN